MLRKAIRLLLVASVLYGTGAHWAALQVYAWSTMKMAKQTDPCNVCKVVEKGTSSQPPLHKVSVPSADFAVTAPVAESVAPAPVSRSEPPSLSVPSLSFPPATPPPDARLPA